MAVEAVFTQITERSGVIERLRPDQKPVIELSLQPGEYVVGVQLKDATPFYSERTTKDWRWSCFVVTPLPRPEREEPTHAKH